MLSNSTPPHAYAAPVTECKLDINTQTCSVGCRFIPCTEDDGSGNGGTLDDCAKCPNGTYQDKTSHKDTSCTSCTKPDAASFTEQSLGNTTNECPWVLECGQDETFTSSDNSIDNIECKPCSDTTSTPSHFDAITITGSGNSRGTVYYTQGSTQHKAYEHPQFIATPQCIPNQLFCFEVPEILALSTPADCDSGTEYILETNATFDTTTRKWDLSTCILTCNKSGTIKTYMVNQNQTAWEYTGKFECEPTYCKMSDTATECTQPAAGYYRTENNDTCQPCPMGTTSNGGATANSIESCYLKGGTKTGTGQDATCNGGTIFRDSHGVFCLPAGVNIHIHKAN